MDPATILARVRGRLRRVVALGGSARLVAVLIAAAGAAVFADRMWFLPGWMRLGLLLGIVATIATLAWRRLIRPLRRPLPDRELASFVERRLPALDGRLLSAVDGIALGSRDVELMAAAVPVGSETTLVPAKALPRTLVAASLALLLAAGIAIAQPSFWREGLDRLLLPLSERAFTELDASVERAVIAADEVAVLHIERTRGRACPVRVSWDDHHGHSGARQLPGNDGPWRQAIPLGAGDWSLSISGGDAREVLLKVLAVERPRLDTATAKLIPPAYSGQPTQDLPTPACQALPGSRLELRLSAGSPGREAASVTATLGETSLPLTRDGGTWTGSAMITAASELVIDASDSDGIAMRPLARFPIAVDPDRAPSVSLSGPRSDEVVGPHAKVAVAIDASDDLGLAAIALTASVTQATKDDAKAPAAAGEPRTLRQEDIDGRRSVQRRLQIDVAALTGPGGTITLLGRATDRNDVTGPGVGTSAPLLLRVVAEDELRRDLEHQLSEARDRIGQARSQIAPGLADAAKLPTGARTAAQDAARATDLLSRVQRRWTENALEADRIAPAIEAQQATSEAAEPLAKAAAGDQDSARAGDAQLAKAERALERILSDSDLTRIIAQLLERQKALLAESRSFVKEHLTQSPDDAGKVRQTDLASRETDLGKRCGDAERKILSGPSALDQAKAAVRSGAPAEAMTGAAADIASDDSRPRSLERQQAAITALEAILKALRGGDQKADLARRVGELADRQERLAEAIERGADPESAQRDQERLRGEAERLAAEVKDPPEADRAMDAAVGAQQGAESALGKKDSSSAARDANTAADLLRQAQKDLDPRSDQKQDDKDKDKDKSQADILALLRALLVQQTEVLADSLPIHKRIGEDEPDFAAKRDLGAVAQLQDDIVLRLREEGIKALDQMPIAQTALKRVDVAMQRVLEHVKVPALGEGGLRLERIALYELKRLIDIAGNMPKKKDDGNGGGGGGGGGNQPPFPPTAEIALLIAEQEDIQAILASGRPGALAKRQEDLAKLVELVESTVPRGTRPGMLMMRARRSAINAGLHLAGEDRGATTRHHMVAASESLLQLLAEAKGQGGGGGGGKKPPPPQPQDGDKPPPPPANGGASSGGNAAGNSSPNPGDTQAGTTVRIDQERTALLQLPPERREQLRQAREQRLPAGALQLYERYLEKLEEP